MRLGRVAVEGREISAERGGRQLFDNLHFAVGPGELLEMIGPNGVGKSSLLRLIAGLVPLTFGKLIFTRNGKRLGDDDPPATSLLHWLSHQDGLKTVMSVSETIAFYGRLFGPSQREDAVLDQVGLSAKAALPVQYLSAGQRRRLAFARLLISERPLWLLDEPFAAVDAQGRALVQGLIASHRAGGGTVIAATHDALAGDARRLSLGSVL
ncbi:MAG: heme ABC exporter ATP-binding protein CcmA [Alphaproteobacteria bacterium]|nr:heme ABC exporter ATP-binding protein CcmA [Alphaproteobacteria bacterium]